MAPACVRLAVLGVSLLPNLAAAEGPYLAPDYDRQDEFSAPCGWEHTGSSTAVRAAPAHTESITPNFGRDRPDPWCAPGRRTSATGRGRSRGSRPSAVACMNTTCVCAPPLFRCALPSTTRHHWHRSVTHPSVLVVPIAVAQGRDAVPAVGRPGGRPAELHPNRTRPKWPRP